MHPRVLLVLLLGINLVHAEIADPKQRASWLLLQKLASVVREISLCALRTDLSDDEANNLADRKTIALQAFAVEARSYVALYSGSARGETPGHLSYLAWSTPFALARQRIQSVSPARCTALLHGTN